MVGERVRRMPAGRDDPAEVLAAGPEGLGAPLVGPEPEVEDEVEFVARRVVGRPSAGMVDADLPDQHRAGVGRRHLPDPAQELVHDRVVEVAVPAIVELGRDAEPNDVGLVVAQGGVLAQPVRGIDAEAVDAPVEPEPEDVVHRRPHRRIAPVQVRLRRRVRVQVVLPVAGSSVQAGPRRRTPRASCSGGRRRQPDRARRTSPAGDRRARSATARTRDAGRRCDWGRSPAARAGPAGAPPGSGRRRRRAAEPRIDGAVVGHVVAEIDHR